MLELSSYPNSWCFRIFEKISELSRQFAFKNFLSAQFTLLSFFQQFKAKKLLIFFKKGKEFFVLVHLRIQAYEKTTSLSKIDQDPMHKQPFHFISCFPKLFLPPNLMYEYNFHIVRSLYTTLQH